MWIKDSSPKTNEWFICIVNGQRMPMMFNVHNQFWVDFSGKTYKPNQIDKWLDDSILSNTISLTKEDLITFSNDIESSNGCWSDTSYKICKFIDIDPTAGV